MSINLRSRVSFCCEVVAHALGGAAATELMIKSTRSKVNHQE
jgi:hypothetical protein